MLIKQDFMAMVPWIDSKKYATEVPSTSSFDLELRIVCRRGFIRAGFNPNILKTRENHI